LSERLEINEAHEERLPFGELAVLEEMLTREQLNALLFQQADRRENEQKNVRIGTLLVREGYLTRKQAKRILKIQSQDGPIEGFQLIQHLGSGGMGSVFRALELETEQEVALKILPPRATRDVRYRTRFLREANLLQQLDHENLVRCSSHGESNGHLYFAMQVVEGPTGRALIKRDGAMREDALIRLMRQLLSAMTHYWSELIVHRDIKPENILFSEDEETALLADLGLSRQLDDDVHITTVGKTLGTPLYISPEMARGRQDIDIRADLYSLGATLYHFGTGVAPFAGASQAELLKQHVEDPPLRPRLKNPRLSKGMEAILLKLLEKDPRDRFAGPSDALAALDRLEAGEDPVPERKRRTWSGGERAIRSSGERRGERVRKGSRQGGSRLGSSGTKTPGTKAHNGNRIGSSATRTGRDGRDVRDGSLRWTPVAALGAFLFLFSCGVLLGSRGNPADAAPADTTMAGATASDEGAFLDQVVADPEAAAVSALAYCRAHPASHEEHVRRLQLVARVLPEDSPQTRAVRLRLVQARELLQEQAEKAFENLRNRLIALVETKRFAEGQALLDAFPSAYRKGEVGANFSELQRDFESAAK
jgi:eukaryotic-like serine/threonine-protein kinase